MPFFHSRYLKDNKKASAVGEASQISEPKSPSNKIWKQSTTKNGSQPSSPQQERPTSPSSPRLVWHSNVGSSRKTQAKKLFSAFQYNDPSKKKTVHFATIEVQQYNWDYTCDPDVYYLKKQIAAMNKQRFTDASKLRKQRNIKLPSKKDKEKAKKACDDVDIAKRATDITQLLQEAFDPERDTDEQVSICGIEHFVYPALQKEMIQRKKQAQREVINFNKPNPQGWRLARLSEANTKWARDVAVEKGKRYCVNHETMNKRQVWKRSRRSSMSDMGRADTGELLHRLGRSEPVFKMPEREAAAPTGAVGMFQQSDEQGNIKATPEQEAVAPTGAVGMFQQSDEQGNIKATPDESWKNKFDER